MPDTRRYTLTDLDERYREIGIGPHDRDQFLAILRDTGRVILVDEGRRPLETITRTSPGQYEITPGAGSSPADLEHPGALPRCPWHDD